MSDWARRALGHTPEKQVLGRGSTLAGQVGACQNAASPLRATSRPPLSLEKRRRDVGRVLNPYTSDFWDFILLNPNDRARS